MRVDFDWMQLREFGGAMPNITFTNSSTKTEVSIQENDYAIIDKPTSFATRSDLKVRYIGRTITNVIKVVVQSSPCTSVIQTILFCLDQIIALLDAHS